MQPVQLLNVIVAVPLNTPTNKPVAEPIVAIEVLLLLQVPQESAVRVAEVPVHRVSGPEIGVVETTVMVVVV
jgi:hypothetical protein